MSTLFTRIINGEIPAQKVLEDDRYLAFLDIRPVRPGHTLVIPKIEHDYIFTLDDETLAGLLPFARRVVPALEQVTGCKRVGVMVAGLEVPHAHVHLIPMNAIPDLNFANAKDTPTEVLAAMGDKVRAALRD
ncbi:MAG: HIT family protein [Acidithiobacillus ferriphilus]|jgi:Diadenosine tetraphosphate (Ap4A) hydrolase and other HIT family hydrolases|uniref:HIT family hydrolase n=3 Tax=Acidithiobacillus TaxID=119977 RepID=A0A179BMJ5_ACIFR|nr:MULTISPECIES: HIT family protein [Acidithiobacillus]OYV81498.1 MAG: HIT family protein [Acidithiobacillus ferrivorans]MBU2785741.1 HIT family protein [Acidithiobacillus ferriphilus]MBU2828136.1 HIT family protein [Acidithiobacillus ferriphilus]MBU2829448.1 HIT family protein [Acidithiobacillus ferriphilus]MBU2831954.1 HIT family protein [Acidithiobacillus ferriphilus]